MILARADFVKVDWMHSGWLQHLAGKIAASRKFPRCLSWRMRLRWSVDVLSWWSSGSAGSLR
jgi:hypothetical protein